MTPETDSFSDWQKTRETLVKRLTHDVNNVIGATYSLSELHGSDEGLEDSVREAFGNIKANASSCHKIVCQITDLFKKGTTEAEYFNLEMVLGEMDGLIAILLPRGVALKMEFTGKEIAVLENLGAFKHRVLNTIAGVRGVIEEKSDFIVRTQVLDERECLLSFIYKGKEEKLKEINITIKLADLAGV